MNSRMLCNRKQYFRFTVDFFRQSRRSFTPKRHLEDLKQIYDLLKEETLSKLFPNDSYLK